MSDTQYLLRSDVSFCISDEHVVFFDLETDGYIVLPIRKASRLQHELAGWPIDCRPLVDNGVVYSNDADEVFEEFLEEDLITTDPSRGKEAHPFIPIIPKQSLAPNETAVSTIAQICSLPSYFMAAREAAAKLRVMDLPDDGYPWRATPKLIRSIQDRKLQRETSRDLFDLHKARYLARIAYELRPWFNEKPDCKINSLIVIEFFARHGLYPDWVFGVQGNPFHAHCWVQHKDIAINETLDVINQFTPIMSV